MYMSRWTLSLAAAAAAAAATIPAQASPTGSGQHSWHEDLLAAGVSRVNATDAGGALRIQDLGIRLGAEPRPSGSLVTPERRLATPVNHVSADAAATVPAGSEVTIEARGGADGGRWTEWREIDSSDGLTLSTPVSTIQLRVTLTAGAASGPAVSDISVTATLDKTRPAQAPTADSGGVSAQALTYRIFATREGLVGGQTANGHIIVNRDHFVALPSRRGLNATNGGRTYQVRVCYQRTGRCETAPVWDVGPWNTKDDYWNPSSTRQMWKTLAQGTPEAQAARLNGFNGGRDEFGRVVANPAGIDLADGTFWDGLGMTDNDWVDVTFLWT
jgi:hypothetical protein